jgi:hypothetical protein
MAPSRAQDAARRPSAEEKFGKTMLKFSKKQVDAFYRRPQIKKEESSPSRSLPSHTKTHTGRKMLKTTLRPIRSVTLRMWNGSRIAIYPAERLAIRW